MTYSIPIISLEKLNSGDDSTYKQLGVQICRATADVGFFYIRDYGIEPALVQSALNASKTFFSFDLDIKKSVAVNQLNRGFMGVGECILPNASRHCIKEVFFWGPEQLGSASSELPLVGANNWPVFMPSLRADLEPYYQAVIKCGERLLRAIALAFNLPRDFFQSRYTSPLARGQLLHYPAPTNGLGEDGFGASAHTDFGCITLLWQDDSGGLEIQSPCHGWVSAVPIRETLVVNIGDLLSFWTGGRLRSTVHRVRNCSGHRRFSMAIFYDPSSDALIDPKDMGCRSGGPPVYAGTYIQSRNRQAFSHYSEVPDHE